MSIWDDTHWFAVQVRPGSENMANVCLQRNEGIEVFLPKVKCLRARKRVVIQALFPGYLFARFQPAGWLDKVKYEQNVIRIVGGREYPTPLDDSIVEDLQGQHGEEGYIDFEELSLKSGDDVVIEEGPFFGLTGRVIREADAHKRVLILLESLQAASVLIEEQHLTRATA